MGFLPIFLYSHTRNSQSVTNDQTIVTDDILNRVGNTPLVKLESLSNKSNEYFAKRSPLTNAK